MDRAQDIIETYDKGYLILGSYPTFSWLIKTDINGQILWEIIIDNYPSEFPTAQSIEATSDGGVLVCGNAFSGTSNKRSPFVMKLDACGEKEWCKLFDGSPHAFPTWAQDIKETDDLAKAAVQRSNLTVIGPNGGVISGVWGFWQLTQPVDNKTCSFMDTGFDSNALPEDEGSPAALSGDLRGRMRLGDFNWFCCFLSAMGVWGK